MHLCLFSVVSSARTRDRGHKLTHRRFSLTVRQHFCAASVPEHWHRFAREAVRMGPPGMLSGQPALRISAGAGAGTEGARGPGIL